MATILLIETSTAACSVALERDGAVTASRVSEEPRSHASLTAVFCDEVLKEVPAIDAVCISDGPGSYTGLRVGLSTAKGICFGTGAGLLAVSSLDILCAMALKCLPAGIRHIVPMIDARRMEVYTAVYDICGKKTSPIEAKVIDSDSFSDIAPETVFIGDGALKCQDVIGSGTFVGKLPLATEMAALAEKEFATGNFRDTAYFEPGYVKDFVATVSKKKLF